MAGPFPDADAAREFCARLASGSLNCTPARFTGADAD